ncbi:MAG TPA: DUF6683 family protein, partial [Pyrinomonadaceae bacterium]|nr:DUF6683 family protein [Pyrinomonadaceae bacterium]
MKINDYLVKSCFVVVVACFLSTDIVTGQHKDMMGGNWNNPVSASIGNIINDRIWNRMRAKARARKKIGSAASADSGASSTDVQPSPKKSSAEIAAATRFRSTGTQLTTRELANASGNTPEEKEQMFKLLSTALALYETEARRLGRPNDFALALAVALAVNSNVYNGRPEPEEARLLELGDAIGELMAEDNVFGGITDKQKQEMYESMVIFTMLVQAGSNEAKQKGDATEVATYRELAGKVLQNISGMSPEKIRLDPDATATAVVNSAPLREVPVSTVAANAGQMHIATLVKEFENNEVRANQLYIGKRVRVFGTVN